jgi:5-methylthioadenosine/S-adenosylhomocysteine deaminase
MIDLLVKHGLVYTMDSSRRIIEDGVVAIKGEQIVYVGSADGMTQNIETKRVVDAKGKAVLPGFVNVHTHLPSIFVRGVYGIVRSGLYQVLFPVKNYLKPEQCYNFGLASCLEALISGSTTIQETYNYMHHFAKAAEVTGIRANLGEQVAEADYQAIREGEYVYLPEQAEEMLKRAEQLKKEWHGEANGRITVSLAPLAPDMCTPWVYEEILKQHELGVKISTHVAQSQREVDQVEKLYGKTSVEYLAGMDILGPDLIGAHCIHNTSTDTEKMMDAGASVLHCPRPYLLEGTTAPLTKWMNMGLKVGLGTDNVHHNMWETMRAAIYGARTRMETSEPYYLSYYDVLELATIKGAEVLGMENSVGSLEPGKKADLQLIDLRFPNIVPTFNVTSSLVLYGSTVNVDSVIVDGRFLKEGGKILVSDLKEVLSEAQTMTDEIWGALLRDRPNLKKVLKGQIS